MIIIFLVRTNGTVLAAYERKFDAEVHERAVTGAVIEEIELRSRVASTVYDDINVDEWNDEETPVEIQPNDVTQTRPSTPRAKAKSKPPGEAGS